MKELNDEIKLTLSLMQTDIDDGAHGELQSHLYSLLEIKRNEMQQRLVEWTWLEFDSGMAEAVASAEHRDDLECLVYALEKIADLKLPRTDGATDFSISQDRWFKFREAQGIAASAISQYRKEPVTRDQTPYKSVKLDGQVTTEAKQLTVDELKAGSWCVDSSDECMKALIEKRLVERDTAWMFGGGYKYCNLAGSIVVMRTMQAHNAALKQIHLVGNEFYWGDA